MAPLTGYGKAGENGCGQDTPQCGTRGTSTAEMHGFFFSGEEEIEIRSGGVPMAPGRGQKTKDRR